MHHYNIILVSGKNAVGVNVNADTGRHDVYVEAVTK